jgi:dephospho-CoA kinase
MVLIVGRSGSGKSTVAPVVRERLGPHGRYVVLDTDLLLHVAQFDWTMWLNDWLLLAYGLAQNGFTLVLCGQIDPEKLEHLPARPFVGEFVVLLLDCSAHVRTARLRARPPWRGWTENLIDDELVESQQMRTRGYDRFCTDATTPELLAAQLTERILQQT